MATLQIRVDDNLKSESDILFSSLGLDTPTAVRIFLTVAQEYNGFPFPVNRRISEESLQAIEDARSHHNLHGPYKNAEDAVRAMLED